MTNLSKFEPLPIQKRRPRQVLTTSLVKFRSKTSPQLSPEPPRDIYYNASTSPPLRLVSAPFSPRSCKCQTSTVRNASATRLNEYPKRRRSDFPNRAWCQHPNFLSQQQPRSVRPGRYPSEIGKADNSVKDSISSPPISQRHLSPHNCKCQTSIV